MIKLKSCAFACCGPHLRVADAENALLRYSRRYEIRDAEASIADVWLSYKSEGTSVYLAPQMQKSWVNSIYFEGLFTYSYFELWSSDLGSNEGGFHHID